MKITRRFAVATLLVIAVAIVLGAPAPASAGQWTLTLYPTANSPSPNATGTVTLYQDPGQGLWTEVHVSVSNLAPNASYNMPVTVLDPGRGTTDVYPVRIQTDAHGNGGGGWSGRNRGYYYDGHYYHYYNYYITKVPSQVYDPSGTVVLTSNEAPPPRITNIVRTNNAVFMQWSGPTNAQFQVQWQPALTLGWNTFSNTITSPAGQFSFLDNGTQTGGLGATRFYRLVQLP